MDQALRALFRPRHLLVTLVVFLGLGGLAGLVVGAAAAEGEAAAVAGTFTFATPRVGDRGHYEVAGAMPLLREGTGFDFEFFDDTLAADQVGQVRTLHRLAVTEVPNTNAWSAARVYRIDAGSGETVAVEHSLDEAEPEADGGVRGRSYVAVDFAAGTGWMPPCGLRHDLQGQSWDLTERAATMPCMFGPEGATARSGLSGAGGAGGQGGNGLLDGGQAGDGGAPGRGGSTDIGIQQGVWTWKATGLAQVAGVQHLRVQLERDGLRWIVYEFREDLPVPLSVSYARPGDAPTTATLTAFQSGGGPAITLTPSAPGAPAPPLQWVPATEWLVDDADLAHPFPLSAAWALARDDPAEPAFRDFLSDHPDAYLAFAAYSDYHEEGRPERHTWSLEVTDLQRTMRLWVEQPPDPAAAPDDPVVAVQSLVFGTTSSPPAAAYSHDVGEADERTLRPEALPAQLPSIASMMAQWRQHAGPAYAQAEPNFWRIDVLCGETCGDIDLRLSVGATRYTRDGDRDTSEQSTLEWWMFPARFPESVDRPGRYAEDTTTWGPAQPATQASPPSAPPKVLASSVASWVMPGATATVGVGASAALAAVAYWLWPLAKGGGLGLFSRVHKDRLLDNPLRQQLVQRIEAEPGVHHNALVRGLGKGKGAAEHHLEKLVAARLVLRHRGTGYTCYFPVGTDRRGMAAAPAVKSDGARQVLEALRNGVPGVRGIAIATGLAPSTVSHHLERLRAAGLVVGDGKSGFRPTTGANPGGLAAA